MKRVVPQVEQSQAERTLGRVTFWRWLKSFGGYPLKRPSHTELVYLPTWLVTSAGRTGARNSGVLVDSLEGTAQIVNTAQLAYDADPWPTSILPRLDAPSAIEIARDQLLKARLNRVSGVALGGDGELAAELIGYPYWAYYFKRSAGMLDAKFLDALTGAPAGPRIKLALFALLTSQGLADAGQNVPA